MIMTCLTDCLVWRYKNFSLKSRKSWKLERKKQQVDSRLKENILTKKRHFYREETPILPWIWRREWIFDSSSEVCEEDEGSTSLTPESAGLGGREPEIWEINQIIKLFVKYFLTQLCHKRMRLKQGHLIDIHINIWINSLDVVSLSKHRGG